jgi:hypothetical protein
MAPDPKRLGLAWECKGKEPVSAKKEKQVRWII